MKTNSLQTSQQTETKPAHTPTPWRFTGEAVLDAKGNNACTKANGPLIVRAVNSHAELIESLEDLIGVGDYALEVMHHAADPKNNNPTDWKGIALHIYAAFNKLPQARAALAKAQA